MSSVHLLGSPGHLAQLRSEERRLVRFPRSVVTQQGDTAVWSRTGDPVPGAVSPTFGTARIAHVFALAAERGEPWARGVSFDLLDYLAAFGARGWPDNPARPTEGQDLYTLAFVILAAASGTAAGHPASPQMLSEALQRLDRQFWEPEHGLAADRADAAGRLDPYRGLNGNMHLAEALFAAADVTGNGLLRARALGICGFVIRQAEQRNWRICEHYGEDWSPLPQHNLEEPHHTFKPYGATVGHGFEWARLLAQSAGFGPAGQLAAATALFDRAAADGWQPGEHPGFCYTTDWDGRPVSTRRLHWVAAEALASASVLFRLTGEDRFAAQYDEWFHHVGSAFMDRESGSWHHEVDAENRAGPPLPTDKPDLYHAYQAVLIPQLPVRTSLAAAVTARPKREKRTTTVPPAVVRLPEA
ncbi:AGE family epimerase/isomerase [Pseudarthrobacter sp. NPDC058362]|uniref:AGE family epimerase/isomerase n=1 Tax=Pseudarthrobacter sp. NPDC058362 TaxID=3346458 RepID=UPI0036612996